VGSPPILRIDGELVSTKNRELTPKDAERLIYSLLSEERKEDFQKQNELDFSFSALGKWRFRGNVHKQRGFLALALRIIPEKIPTVEELGLPPAVYELASRRQGLVLVTGPAGCGKSTTQAAMIDFINSERACHIITIEDPVEYLHKNKKGIIKQREVGSDTHSFSQALRYVLRQDPDVILIGEMRDLETISTAVTAAETGHLVLATLHTMNAPQAVDRITDVFPGHEQQQIRLQLSITLQGVIAQQLLPRTEEKGRVVAVEIMLATAAIRNLIRENRTAQIYSNIALGAKYGMQTMEQALEELYRKGIIKYRDILIATESPKTLGGL
jgi:twitching motility protein PilT